MRPPKSASLPVTPGCEKVLTITPTIPKWLKVNYHYKRDTSYLYMYSTLRNLSAFLEPIYCKPDILIKTMKTDLKIFNSTVCSSYYPLLCLRTFLAPQNLPHSSQPRTRNLRYLHWLLVAISTRECHLYRNAITFNGFFITSVSDVITSFQPGREALTLACSPKMFIHHSSSGNRTDSSLSCFCW